MPKLWLCLRCDHARQCMVTFVCHPPCSTLTMPYNAAPDLPSIRLVPRQACQLFNQAGLFFKVWLLQIEMLQSDVRSNACSIILNLSSRMRPWCTSLASALDVTLYASAWHRANIVTRCCNHLIAYQLVQGGHVVLYGLEFSD